MKRMGHISGRIAMAAMLCLLCLLGCLAPLTQAFAEDEVTLSLYRRNPQENAAFTVVNMFPGDQVEKTFRLRVTLGDEVTVYHRAQVRPGYEKLAEVLRCRVQIEGASSPLYDGLMRDMPSSLDHTLVAANGRTQEIVYCVTAYLDTSVGNEYQDRQLVADLYWWAEQEDLDIPVTGDDFALYFWLLVLLAAAVVMILVLRSRKGENRA